MWSFFEIDAPETQALKKAKLEEGGVNPNTTYISANYVTDGMIDLLTANGFDVAVPTHVIWEGNTMYLNDAAVRQVLADLMQKAQRCSLSFDYMAEEVIEDRTGDHEITSVVKRFAAMGAPWTYGINNLEKLVDECGATVLDSVKLSQLHRTYWPNLASLRLLRALYGEKCRSSIMVFGLDLEEISATNCPVSIPTKAPGL